MLLDFTCGNYLSFLQDKTLDMTAASAVKEHIDDNVVLSQRYKVLKSAVIYGANASGKSNLLKALQAMKWMVINSSKDLQKGEELPVESFALSVSSRKEPSEFEVTILIDEVRYRYGFEAAKAEISSEWLFRSRKIKEEPLFLREGEGIQVFQKFSEGKGLEERTRENALFLSVCAQFNGEISEKVLSWFASVKIISGLADKTYQRFSEKMFDECPQRRLQMLEFLRKSDLGIKDLSINRQTITEDSLSSNLPKELQNIFFNREESLISTFHDVYDEQGKPVSTMEFNFETQESEGTKKFFRISGPIFDALMKGSVLVVDELDARLHPALTLAISKLFNSRISNPKGAQLIFATHDTNLLSADVFRRDQIWFAEKDHTEASDLYSLSEYKLAGGKVRNDASFEKDYIRGRYGAIPYLGDVQGIMEQLWEEQ